MRSVLKVGTNIEKGLDFYQINPLQEHRSTEAAMYLRTDLKRLRRITRYLLGEEFHKMYSLGGKNLTNFRLIFAVKIGTEDRRPEQMHDLLTILEYSDII